MRRTRLTVLAVAAAVLAAAASSPVAGNNGAGFHTSQPAMLAGTAPDVSVTPIITVGETLPGGYRFESLPDGLALATPGRGRVDVWINHETSLVPFPATRSDFTNAMVSELALNQHSAGVLTGRLVIPSSANYQRFCSSFLASEEHSFERDLLFTNEEATDFVYRTGAAWPLNEPADPRVPEQAGVVVALDVKKGEYRSIYGMGRHNHENSVAVAGYGHPVVLSGDDTFSAPSSQLYMYTAPSAAAVWDDEGSLWAFASDDPAVNDYGDLTTGASVAGSFIPVPRAIAVGDQTGLENWSNANNVFQFIRVEDIAYDRSQPNVVYLADTGEPRAIADPATGRLGRGPAGTQGPYPNGRLFKLVLDPSDPTVVESLSILIDADAGGYGNVDVIHQPDNVETTARSLLIQEDPGSHNQGGTAARIWRYDLESGQLEIVARIDQSLAPSLPLGSWESSGIIDASTAFGAGAFLVDVQAHGLELEEQPGPNPPVVFKREAGQLLLLRIPGA